MIRSIAWSILAVGIPLAAQTQVDLRTQSKTVDFGSAPSTRPFSTGGALPPTCVQGDMYFLTVAAAGANMYGCTTSNTWSPEYGVGSGVDFLEVGSADELLEHGNVRVVCGVQSKALRIGSEQASVVGLGLSSQAEVNEFGNAVGSKYYVGGFYVSMNYEMLMRIVNRGTNRTKYY